MSFRKSIILVPSTCRSDRRCGHCHHVATGIAIAFEEEILRWHDRRVSHLEKCVSEKGTVRLTMQELTQKIEANQGGKVSSIAVFSDPGRAWEVHFHNEGPFYLDPFTGTMQASQAHGAHEIIHKLEEWHRWLEADDGQVSVGRIVTGISNLSLVILCVTGLYL